MLTIQNLAVEIQKNISSGIRQFQSFLSSPQIFCHESILKVIADIMATDMFTHEQKQLAAASLNFILTKRLNQNFQLFLNHCWNEYFTFFTERQPGDQIQWKYVCLTIKVVRKLVEQLSQQVAVKSIQKFKTSSFVGKVMLMNALKDNDEVSERNSYLFFTQTIDEFLLQTWKFLKDIHNSDINSVRDSQKDRGLPSINENTLLFEHDVIMVIQQWLQIISQYQEQGWHLKLDDLAKNPHLVHIIKQQMRLCIVEGSNNKLSYKINDGLICLCEDMIHKQLAKSYLNRNEFQQKVLSNMIQIKAYVLNIIKHLARTFSIMSGLQQFDNIQVLSLIQLLTPVLIDFLHNNNDIKKIYHQFNDTKLNQASNSLLTAIFSILNLSATFIFLMQSLSDVKSIVLYSVFTTYLKAPESELEIFTENGKEFIEISQNCIQKYTLQKCQTPKQACGNFLQSYLKLIESVQVEFIQFLSDSLKYHTREQKSQSLANLQSKGYIIPSIQTIYTILTRIYFFADKSNQYFLDFVYNNFIDQEFVFQFKKIEKVRFLIFIQYTYEQYFSKDISKISNFMNFAYETKDKSQVEFRTFLEFMQSSFKYGIAQNIWEFLIKQIEKTHKRQILSVINRLLAKYIAQIPKSKIQIMTIKINERVKRYFKQKKSELTEKGFSYDFLYKFFQILQTLAANQKLITQQTQIMRQIMDLIDFFSENDLQNFEFSGEVIKLLNCLIQAKQEISQEFLKYVSTLGKVVQQNKSYGTLLETYYLILLKGGQTFERNPQFLQKVKYSIEEKLLSPSNRTADIIVESIFLLQNIYLVYPHLIKENRRVYDATLVIYETEKQNQNPNTEIVASILLFWMSGQYVFGDYNLGTLNDCKIQIFRQQFGLMFALNLKKLIEKYYDTESLSYLLKLSVKLLDYEHHYKNDKKYRGPVFTLPIFKKYLLLDSFQQINSAIQFLRENLSRERFLQSLQILRSQFGIQKVNQLLQKRIFNNRTQRNIVTVKRN